MALSLACAVMLHGWQIKVRLFVGQLPLGWNARHAPAFPRQLWTTTIDRVSIAQSAVGTTSHGRR
jgi:hypothetical protein